MSENSRPADLTTSSAMPLIVTILRASVLVLLLGAAYFSSLLPGLGHSGDTAEFQFIGKVLGVPHPTGYPTYVVLNGLFVRLVRLGSLAFRANLLSALLAMLAVTILYRIVGLFVSRRSIALLAALSFGLTRVFWSQAVVAEVYTLNAVFVGLVLWAFLRWHGSRLPRDLLIACGLYACSFGNHLTMITMLPAILLLVFTTQPTIVLRWRIMLGAGLLIVCGASQYLFLVWRAHCAATPFLYCDVGSWRSLLALATGAQFHERMFAFSWTQVGGDRLPLYLQLFCAQFWWSVPLIVIGMIIQCRRVAGLFLLAAFLGCVLYGVNYDIEDISVYFIPSFMIAAIWLGIGADALVSTVKKQRWLPVVVTAAYCLLPARLYVINRPLVDQSESRELASKTETVLSAARHEALLVSGDWQTSNALWYVLLGEQRYRDDVFVVHDFVPDELHRYLVENRPLYLPHIRRETPPGLDVYALKRQHVDELQRTGLYAFAIGPDLFAIRAEPDIGSHLARKHHLSEDVEPLIAFSQGWQVPEEWGRWATAAEATIIVTCRRAPAELVIRAAHWPEVKGPVDVAVRLNERPLGDFSLAGANWDMQEFVFPLSESVTDGVLKLSIRRRDSADIGAASQYQLPVGSIEIRRASPGLIP